MCRTRSPRHSDDPTAPPQASPRDRRAAIRDGQTRGATLILVSTASSQHDPHLATPTGKPRARSVGLKYRGAPGPHNAITDVPGVEVGYTTLIEGDSVRTGVTAIHPRGKHNPGDPLAAEAMRLEGTRRWVPGSQEGFQELLKALDESPARGPSA